MNKESCSRTLMTLMIICASLSFITLGIVVFDKFIREEPEKTVVKPPVAEYSQNNQTEAEQLLEDIIDNEDDFLFDDRD